jgi:hypothetical protein
MNNLSRRRKSRSLEQHPVPSKSERKFQLNRPRRKKSQENLRGNGIKKSNEAADDK